MSQSTPGGRDELEQRVETRLRDVATEPASDARLGLMIGEQRWLVELSQAGEIVPVPDAIAPVPLTQAWLLGLVNLRGALYTVVDLRRFAGVGRTDPGKESRLLALATRLNFNAAILVTRMFGLRNVAAMHEADSIETPGHDLGHAHWVGRTFIDAEGQRWHELDLSRLAASSEFLMAGR
jgi:twitching motility protein PilI